MTDVSVLGYARPRSRRRSRRRSASWLWSVIVAASVVTAGLAGLDFVGRPAPPPLLRASFVGTSTPEVDLQAAPAVALRTGPINVPSDPYADEPIVEIGSLVIAKLGVQERLMDGVTLRNIDLGPSHWPGTALPGEPGNMVVAGHRVTHSRPFRNLDQLVAGDPIVVTANGRQATYRVVSSFVVSPTQTEIANPTPTPSLTLYACHPPGSARQRIVVRAELAGVSAA